MPQALEAADEELLVDDHDDDGQQQLRQPHRHMVVVIERRQRPAPHHMPHGEIHQHDQKADRPDQTPLEHRRIVILQLFLGFRGRRRALCALDRRAIAGFLHRRDDRLLARRALDAHGVGQKAHRAACHARHLRDRLLHARAACRAAHARYIVLFHVSSHSPPRFWPRPPAYYVPF